MSESIKHRIAELNTEIGDKEMERDLAIDDDDPGRVEDLEMEIEALNADLRNFEMQLEKSGG